MFEIVQLVEGGGDPEIRHTAAVDTGGRKSDHLVDQIGRAALPWE